MYFWNFFLHGIVAQAVCSPLLKLEGTINKQSIDTLHESFLKDPYQNDYILYLNTNGGSISEGLRIMPFLETKNVTCVVDRAYSMGFFLLQNCDQRYILPYGSIMQHDMSLNLADEFPKIQSYLEYLTTLYHNLIEKQTERIGMNKNTFLKKIRDDWWMNSTQAVEQNCVDGIIPSLTSFPSMDTC